MKLKAATKSVEIIDHAKTGQIMRVARASSRLSLRTVASRLGVSAPFLSDLERGRRNWTTSMVSRFCEALMTKHPKA
jgi:predicted transcriptional regulator